MTFRCTSENNLTELSFDFVCHLGVVFVLQRFGIGLDASIESRAQKSAPREFSPSLRRHYRTGSGVLMCLGLPSPAPSALGLSQSLDGLFPRAICLSYFIQVPPMGFKELGSESMLKSLRFPGRSRWQPSTRTVIACAIIVCFRQATKSLTNRFFAGVKTSTTSCTTHHRTCKQIRWEEGSTNPT
jgi:hypothetical protein